MIYRHNDRNLKFDDIRELKQRESDDREVLRAERSEQEQLNRLDTLLGAGVGAVRERVRLHQQIRKEQ